MPREGLRPAVVGRAGGARRCCWGWGGGGEGAAGWLRTSGLPARADCRSARRKTDRHQQANPGRAGPETGRAGFGTGPRLPVRCGARPRAAAPVQSRPTRPAGTGQGLCPERSEQRLLAFPSSPSGLRAPRVATGEGVKMIVAVKSQAQIASVKGSKSTHETDHALAARRSSLATPPGLPVPCRLRGLQQGHWHGRSAG